MGKFVSVFIATVQYAFGIYVFKKPDLSCCGPLLSSLVVLLALSFILWSLPLYPRRLRKLVWSGNYFAQYIAAVFLIEYIMGCFWFPLEAAALAFLPNIATTLEDSLLYLEMTCTIPCDILRKEGTGMFISYILSFLILIASLHATRVINLTLLSCGVNPFFHDLSRRSQKFLKQCPVNLGIYRFRPRRPRRQEHCPVDEDEFEFENVTGEPTTDSESHYTY